MVALSGCAGTIRRVPFTAEQSAVAGIAGAPDIRFWADAPDAAQRMRPAVAPGTPVTMLALSGGGDEGAYGAGLLNGWTKSGTRPQFTVVTGVSTGALIAPFAFLGPEYDASLKRVYTQTGAKDIFHPRFPLALLSAPSVASTEPLAKLIAREVTPELVDRIADAHRAGRRLFVGTTNLDAQRGVIWDMGALAASTLPDKVELFRKVLRASSAIPVVFPPVAIDATAGAAPVTELHVDGGVVAQFLGVPPEALVEDRPVPGTRRLTVYLVMNSRLGADFQFVRKARIGNIGTSALNLDLQASLLTLAQASYLYASRHAVDWNLSYIGNDIDLSTKPFDTKYMRGLYDYGFARGSSGGQWAQRPPAGDQQMRDAGKATCLSRPCQ